MAHWFKLGIDWAADPTGNTPLPNWRFVSPRGDDANAGTDPNVPKKTIYNALINHSGSSGVPGAPNTFIAVESGQYNDNVRTAFIGVMGDGMPVIDGLNHVKEVSNDRAPYLDNLIVKDYRIYGGTFNFPYFINCRLVDCRFENGGGAILEDCILVNCQQVSGSYVHKVNNSIFINTPWIQNRDNDPANYFVKNSYFDAASPLTSKGDVRFCNAQGGYNITGVGYEEANINADPRFHDRDKLLFNLYPDSPHIGAGENGSVIANGRIGVPMYSGAALFNNAEEVTNIGFDALDQIEVINGATQGHITTEKIVFSDIKPVARLNIGGIPDYSVNVPAAVKANPHLTYEMRWAGVGEDITTKPWKAFRYNEVPYENAADGKTTGEAGFNWGDTNKIYAKEVQYKLTFRNDHLQA